MALLKEEKEHIIKKFQRQGLDTGSSEVQIALLTYKINRLIGHFKDNKKDNHSRHGLVRMVNKRRKLLDYLRNRQPDTYKKVLDDLNLRK